MKSLLLSSLVLGGAFLFPYRASGNQQPSVRLVAEDNVNSRYTVESIVVGGEAQPALPTALRQKVASLVGQRFDPSQIEELAQQIRKELHLRSVTPHVLRGSEPDTVRVALETERHSVEFDLSVPKFLYHSLQGWSAQVQASTTIAKNVIRLGLVSDGDELTERFAGYRIGYESPAFSRVRFQMLVEEFHEQWNRATVLASTNQNLYRARSNVQPTMVIFLARPLQLTIGASIEGMEGEGRDDRTYANALVSGLRYDRRMEGAGAQSAIDAAYSLRVARSAFGGSFSYSRHMATAHYGLAKGRQTLSDDLLLGAISGKAPEFERFVLGTSSLLRGWNRYEIDPLGGDRVVHNSIEYGYRIGPGTVHGFYDVGALWNTGDPSPVRHSLGVSYRQSVFSLALALPVRQGRTDPVFMVGMNY